MISHNIFPHFLNISIDNIKRFQYSLTRVTSGIFYISDLLYCSYNMKNTLVIKILSLIGIIVAGIIYSTMPTLTVLSCIGGETVIPNNCPDIIKSNINIVGIASLLYVIICAVTFLMTKWENQEDRKSKFSKTMKIVFVLGSALYLILVFILFTSPFKFSR
jgi:hypothetical protein